MNSNNCEAHFEREYSVDGRVGVVAAGGGGQRQLGDGLAARRHAAQVAARREQHLRMCSILHHYTPSRSL